VSPFDCLRLAKVERSVTVALVRVSITIVIILPRSASPLLSHVGRRWFLNQQDSRYCTGFPEQNNGSSRSRSGACSVCFIQIRTSIITSPKGIADLIDLLECDDDGRISTESYEPLNNYMANNDSLFDSTNRNELMPLINFRKWIEAYWMWSRTSPGHEYTQENLESLVSRWMDEVARSAMPTSSKPLATVLSIFVQDARTDLESGLITREQSTTAGLDTYSRS
jgi:hypothetical protein